MLDCSVVGLDSTKVTWHCNVLLNVFICRTKMTNTESSPKKVLYCCGNSFFHLVEIEILHIVIS